jgi:hypothetical protein
MNIEAQLEGNQSRRMASQNRFLSRIERLEAKAEVLIGELIRDGQTVYYLNLLNKSGNLTGKVKESTSFTALADYAIRNGYVY